MTRALCIVGGTIAMSLTWFFAGEALYFAVVGSEMANLGKVIFLLLTTTAAGWVAFKIFPGSSGK